MNFRVGFGFDVHRTEAGKPFWLGGIQVPSSRGAVGHSDADVIIHAICDALLGAANLNDIGNHFPDTSDEFRGIDSKLLLKKVMVLLQERSYKVSNVDCTLVLEEPKIKQYIVPMKEALSLASGLSSDQISIKATTNEKLGFIGRLEGVSCYAVALIYKVSAGTE